MISTGPIYTILSSDHKQALWLGYWSTIDNFYTSDYRDRVPEYIELELDNDTIRLTRDEHFAPKDQGNWQTYAPPAPGCQNHYYPVSTQQLLKLKLAENIRIIVNGDRSRVYSIRGSMGPMIDAFIDFVG